MAHDPDPSLVRDRSRDASPYQRSARSTRTCPACGRGLMRVHRLAADRGQRDPGSGRTLHRFRCVDAGCDWQGLLPAGARSVRGRAGVSAAPRARWWQGPAGAGLSWRRLAGVLGAMALLVLAGVQGSRLLPGLAAGDAAPTRTVAGQPASPPLR